MGSFGTRTVRQQFQSSGTFLDSLQGQTMRPPSILPQLLCICLSGCSGSSLRADHSPVSAPSHPGLWVLAWGEADFLPVCVPCTVQTGWLPGPDMPSLTSSPKPKSTWWDSHPCQDLSPWVSAALSLGDGDKSCDTHLLPHGLGHPTPLACLPASSIALWLTPHLTSCDSLWNLRAVPVTVPLLKTWKLSSVRGHLSLPLTPETLHCAAASHTLTTSHIAPLPFVSYSGAFLTLPATSRPHPTLGSLAPFPWGISCPLNFPCLSP